MTAEGDARAWLETIEADTLRTVQTAPAATIVPRQELHSGRSEALLAALALQGHAIELRPGKVIGEGGMGVVREAEQVALGRTIAVKTLKPERTDPVAARDLLREAWITGSLEHPNVVPVHHLEVDDAQLPLLILKRVDGVEWSKLLGDPGELPRRFGATDALAWNLGILGQVLNALRFAHSRGVLHRDLKPSNVMIGNFGEVYLLDWGLAVSLRDDGTGRFPLASEATALAGTPSYMAPEMLGRGGPALSERTDVYLAGAVLHELVTGQPPHRGSNAFAILSSVAVSAPELPADVPVELAQIIRRAMQPDPADRHDSIAALQLAIQGYLEHRGSDRLAARARLRLDELLELSRSRAPERREEIYRQLAICRFAFHEALAAWRDNTDAQAGLSRATTAVAEYELACGDPRAAVALLNELVDPPALLAEAKDAAAALTAQHRKLEELRADLDPSVGNFTRNLAAGVGAAFTLAPLVPAYSEVGLQNHAQQIVWALVFGLLFLAMLVIRRGAKMTVVNRRVIQCGAFLFMAQAIVSAGAYLLGISVDHTQILHLFLYGVIGGGFAIMLEPYLWISSAGYFVAFLVASRYPSTHHLVTSASNGVFTVVVLWRWWARTRRGAPR